VELEDVSLSLWILAEARDLYQGVHAWKRTGFGVMQKKAARIILAASFLPCWADYAGLTLLGDYPTKPLRHVQKTRIQPYY
jgi:hypothetical protein